MWWIWYNTKHYFTSAMLLLKWKGSEVPLGSWWNVLLVTGDSWLCGWPTEGYVLSLSLCLLSALCCPVNRKEPSLLRERERDTSWRWEEEGRSSGPLLLVTAFQSVLHYGGNDCQTCGYITTAWTLPPKNGKINPPYGAAGKQQKHRHMLCYETR